MTKRFRISGTAHDGQPWVLAPALVTFAEQIEELRPTNHNTDGTVAGAGHDDANPNSDHTVWPQTGSGVVYAIDVGDSEGTVPEFAELLRASRDPRIKYLIHNRRIFSSYSTSTRRAWEWGSYSGYNAHLNHMHLSVHHASNLSTDARPWALGQPQDEEDQMLKETLIDLAFAAGWAKPDTQAAREYWYAVDTNSSEWQDMRNAIIQGALKLRTGAGGGLQRGDTVKLT